METVRAVGQNILSKSNTVLNDGGGKKNCHNRAISTIYGAGKGEEGPLKRNGYFERRPHHNFLDRGFAAQAYLSPASYLQRTPRQCIAAPNFGPSHQEAAN